MTRGCGSALLVIALAAGLPLRFARLDARPMHHDEANQAVKFGALLERGEYRYDARDHHGPTLYYLTLPAAWLRGQTTLASLDEWTLRGVTAVFGLATILLLPLLSPAIGRTAVAAGALLMALSPAMVFFSRMFIQESLFAGFALAFVIALGRVVGGGGLRWAAAAGVAAGLAVATKETAVIVLPAALVACTLASHFRGGGASAPPVEGRMGGFRLHRLALGRRGGPPLLLLFLHLSGRPPRAVSRCPDLRRSRHVPSEPRAPVALLPPASDLLAFRRAVVERRRGRRPCGRRGSVGVVATRARRKPRRHSGISGHVISPPTS